MRRIPLPALIGLASLVACDTGAYRAQPLDGVLLTDIMARARVTLISGDGEAFMALYPAYFQEVGIQGDWKTLQRQKSEFGAERMAALLDAPNLGTVTPNADLAHFSLTNWFDFPEGLGRYRSVYQTVWSFEREEESGDWRLRDLTVHHPAFEYDDLHGDLVRLPRSHLLKLDLNWESSLDPEPLWRQTWEAMASGNTNALLNCSVSGTLAAAVDNKVDLPNVATQNEDGDYNQRSARRFTEGQIKELMRFCREMKTTPEALSPLFRFFPVETLPENCRMMRMKMGYRGRGLQFGTTAVSVSWTGFRPQDRWLTEAMWVEYAEVAGF